MSHISMLEPPNWGVAQHELLSFLPGHFLKGRDFFPLRKNLDIVKSLQKPGLNDSINKGPRKHLLGMLNLKTERKQRECGLSHSFPRSQSGTYHCHRDGDAEIQANTGKNVLICTIQGGWGALCTLLKAQNGHIDETAGQTAGVRVWL